jgi:glutamate 5-kinase
VSENHKSETERGKRLSSARRVVIKVGTSTVMGEDGQLCTERMEPIVRSIAQLMKDGRQVVLVSSGAVGLGRGWLGLHRSRLDDMATKQACAAVGQSLLMDSYKHLFAAWDVKVAQVLLTEEDFTNWRRYSNLQHTMEKLLGFGVIPIVNENDTVSTAELESTSSEPRVVAFSDNDRLAALVMSGLEADALVLLTNVDGLLRQGPRGNESGAHGTRRRLKQPESGSEDDAQNGNSPRAIPVVEEITPELRELASGPSASGRGGMRTKLEAAEIAMNCGGTAVIANGDVPDILGQIFAGESVGTVFLPSGRMRGKRRWIAYAAGVRGRVVVDAGAHKALTQRKASLLASGVVRVESPFASMDVVSIVDGDGREFARGIANCASQQAEELSGRKSSTTTGRSGTGSLVLVTRDNIVLMQK